MSRKTFDVALAKLQGKDEVLKRLMARVNRLLAYAQVKLREEVIPDGSTAQRLVESLFEDEGLGPIEAIYGNPPDGNDDYVCWRGSRCYRRLGKRSSGGAYEVYVDVGRSPIACYVAPAPSCVVKAPSGEK